MKMTPVPGIRNIPRGKALVNPWRWDLSLSFSALKIQPSYQVNSSMAPCSQSQARTWEERSPSEGSRKLCQPSAATDGIRQGLNRIIQVECDQEPCSLCQLTIFCSPHICASVCSLVFTKVCKDPGCLISDKKNQEKRVSAHT